MQHDYGTLAHIYIINISTVPTEIDEDRAIEEMKELLAEEMVDKPKIFFLQTATFTSRRRWMRTLGDCVVAKTVDEYPILKEMDFIEREFEMCLEGAKVDDLFDRFNEMMTVLDRNLKSKKGETKKGEDGSGADVLALCHRLSTKIKMIRTRNTSTSKKLKPVLSRTAVSS